MSNPALEALTRRGFIVHHVEDAAQAKQLLLSLIPDGTSVGVGGSMTIKQLAVTDDLRQKSCPIYWHWEVPPQERPAMHQKASQADYFLASTNAVTKDGELVNIDGGGNRVAGMFYGPKQVILVIGSQKLVDGGVNAAVARIKRHACPANARRLNLDTPCAHTGLCNEPKCGDACMCRVTTVLNRPTLGKTVTIIWVDEALGY